jgi:hypothetical protein
VRKRSAFSWAALFGALAIAASCAQGSNDVDDEAGAPAGADAGRESLDASNDLETDGASPVGDDSGGPAPGDDSGGSTSDDAGTTDDAGSSSDDAAVPPVHDAGHTGGTDAGSVVPTTCAEAYQGYGCCVGNDLYYCNAEDSVTEKKCTGGEVCGWKAADTYYDCVSPPAEADPGGAHPIACK